MTFFKSINKVHQYQPRLASKISYYLSQARTNYGKFNIQFFGAKVLKRIAFLQPPSGSVMYFIFQFLHGHFPCLLLFVCVRVCVNRKSCPQFYVNVGYLQIFSAWPSHLDRLAYLFLSGCAPFLCIFFSSLYLCLHYIIVVVVVVVG